MVRPSITTLVGKMILVSACFGCLYNILTLFCFLVFLHVFFFFNFFLSLFAFICHTALTALIDIFFTCYKENRIFELFTQPGIIKQHYACAPRIPVPQILSFIIE